ncbi:MAG: hypothetical protein JOZ31_25100 [Verrucomicrobia bacterium]|nr:hypothetical protein [Verrucomicrobiota bacterium]
MDCFSTSFQAVPTWLLTRGSYGTNAAAPNAQARRTLTAYCSLQVLPDLVWNQFVDSRAMKWLQQNSPGLQAWVQRPKDFDLKGRSTLGHCAGSPIRTPFQVERPIAN